MRRFLPAAALLLAALAVLAGCAADTRPADHTVSYYDGDGLLAEELVPDGGSPAAPPAEDAVWLDGTGALVEPASLLVTEDIALTLWHAPAFSATPALLMPTEQSRFFPDAAVTRAEAASILYALMDRSESYPPGAAFTDITGSEHEDEIRAVSAARLMLGYPDGTFRPEDEITRAEFFAALCRFRGAAPSDPDDSGLPADYWAAEAVACAAARGWTSPDEACPEAPLTRAEAAILAVRARGDRLDGDAIELACGGRTPFVDVLPQHRAFAEIVEAAYTNELLDYVTGRASDVTPGLTRVGDELGLVSADTLRLERLEQGFYPLDDGLYYAEEDGYFFKRFDAGLYELEGSMYCVPETGGPFLTDGSCGCLDFGADGRYTTGDAELDGYVDELMRDILENDLLTREEKLFEAYCLIRDGDYYYRFRPKTGWERGSVSWAPYCAKIMYTEKYGTCYYWAAAFLYLARRLGYQAEPVAGGVGTRNQLHAWVTIAWDDGQEYIFDVELEWAYRHGFYDVSYTTTNMYMQPLYATHVIYVFPGRPATYYSFYGVGAESDDDYLDIPEEDQIPQPPGGEVEDEEPPDGDVPAEEDEDTGGTGADTDTDAGGGTEPDTGGDTGGTDPEAGDTGGQAGGDAGDTGADTGGGDAGGDPGDPGGGDTADDTGGGEPPEEGE